ncbi:MAG: bifunctional UDP-N-acetylmuramoyl-tripeptide:D-alanyl-D-alanine ligase/alanine racemase, partial [Muribaculaceae bacterium]|nr:bifunctional UDP-N-acetylmuramoyl-tripeptide:D-alanyl-D-alanine ligase/alanine racemase [Muribaculaceae bacterium]
MLISEIASRLSLPQPKFERNINHLLMDSRSLESPDDTLFFAIPTAGNDGHRYIAHLYEEGVKGFVVNYIPEEMKGASDVNWLIVPDSIEALQKTASRPAGFNGSLLAITGSRGKTTLKEWIFQLMEPLADIARSPRSYNSKIGVPLSMWEIKPSTSLAVIEAGISEKGEMNSLAQCISPDTVIITNIGEAHAEGFSSLREKTEEKLKLAAAPSVKRVIFSADAPLISDVAKKMLKDKECFTWSAKGNDADVNIEVSQISRDEMKVDYTYQGKRHSFTAPFSSEADVENGANALAFMIISGIDADVIAERFRNLHKIGTRLNVSDGVNGCSVILDQYTSDFSSLRPALDFIRRRKTPAQTLTLVLSDLHHEDMKVADLYSRIAGLVKKARENRVICVGQVLKKKAALLPKGS